MTYNTRSPAVKRLMKEAQELAEATELYYASPLEDNLFEWHFTIRGPADTEFEGGLYHGRILLPPEYPMKPPNILLMTPSGRFEINRKICLSISGYHPETWRPSWSIRTALLAIIGFMPSHGVGAIGSLEYPPEERRKLAKLSVDFSCGQCGPIKEVLKGVTDASASVTEEAMTLANQITFTGEKPGSTSDINSEKPSSQSATSSFQYDVTAQSQSQLVPSDAQEHVVPPSLIPLSFDQWKAEKSKHHEDKEVKEVVESTGDVNQKPSQAKETEETSQNPAAEDTNNKENNHAQTRGTPDTNIGAGPKAPPPTTAPPRNTTTTNSSIVQLQHRQTYLLKLILVLTSILIVLLAVRLNNVNHVVGENAAADYSAPANALDGGAAGGGN